MLTARRVKGSGKLQYPNRWRKLGGTWVALPLCIVLLVALAAIPCHAQQAEPVNAQQKAQQSPWIFDVSLYAWLPGVTADMSTGLYSAHISESLIDTWKDTKSIPIVAMGRFEARYKQLGGYLDASYFNLNFKDQPVKGVETGLLMQMGLLEYALTYQIAGETVRDPTKWTQSTVPPGFIAYGGARTIWMKQKIEPTGLPGGSTTDTLTSPLVGGRATFGISPRWSFMIDGNIGGFDVMNVNLAVQGMGVFAYHTKIYDLPAALLLGYKVLYLDVSSSGGLNTADMTMTLHGPVIGMGISW
jgi:hypothetical protein